MLYRFELNLRSASILGLIGAGGIGTLIFALQTRSLGQSRYHINRISYYGRNC